MTSNQQGNHEVFSKCRRYDSRDSNDHTIGIDGEVIDVRRIGGWCLVA